MKYALLIGLVALITIPTSAQSWYFGWQPSVRDNTVSSFVYTGTNYHIPNTPFGIWGFAGITPGWAEYLAGASVNTTLRKTYFEFGLGGGVEQPHLAFRPAASFLVVNEKLLVLLFIELGIAKGTSSWYQLKGSYTVYGPFALGIHAERYVGFGPKVQAAFGPKPTATIWTGPMWDYENQSHPRGMTFGVHIDF